MGESPFYILMAEDDEDDQLILSDAINKFNRAHVKIGIVNNGAELLLCLHKAIAGKQGPLPDVILLDINMPVLDGLTTLKQLKSDDLLRHIPVYIVTTMRNMDKLEQCLEKGAVNFFTKPNSISGYVSIVEEVMSNVLHSS